MLARSRQASGATGRSWVLNLRRRVDRRERFVRRYVRHGPDLDLAFVDAVDGTHPQQLRDHPLLPYASAVGDYGRNPRVRATILSHVQAWAQIAESGDDYGLIFEDDVLFREDGLFRDVWPALSGAFPPDFTDGSAIVYLGLGSRLPPETTEGRAAHVTTRASEGFGPPDLESPYVFDWLGAFSYALSRRGARHLLAEVARHPIGKPADQWLKDRFDGARYATVPLLTTHAPHDVLVYDSDIWGLPAPVEDHHDARAIAAPDRARKVIAFLIPAGGDAGQVPAVIDSIVASRRGDLGVAFAIGCDDETNAAAIRAAIGASAAPADVTIVTGAFSERPGAGAGYDQLARVALARGADLLAVWDDATRMRTPHWDAKLAAHDAILFDDAPDTIACFQVRETGSPRCRSPILTRRFVEELGLVFSSPSVPPFVTLVALLARVTVFVRSVETDRLADAGRDDADGRDRALFAQLAASPRAKAEMDRAIARLRQAPDYRPFGAWVSVPPGWAEREVIGTMADDLPGIGLRAR